MPVARDVELSARQILRGDVASLRPALVPGLAGRCALRALPGLALERASTSADQRRLVLAGYAGALAALLAALRRPADPSLPARLAAVVGVELDSWPAARSAESVAVAAAAAAAADQAGATTWLQRAVVAGAGNAQPDATRDDTAGLAAAEDFREFHGATLRTPVTRLLARPLWPSALRATAQPDIDRWQVQLEALGLHTLEDEYRRLLDGRLPDADELNDALVAALQEAAPLPDERPIRGLSWARGGRSVRPVRPVLPGRSARPQTPAAPPDSQPDGDAAPAPAAARATSPEKVRGDETGPHVPTARDLEACADAVARLITDPRTPTPFVLAINGAPGAGKTTVANLVRERITSGGRVAAAPITCWFDAWAHDGDDLSRALLASVIRLARAHRPRWRRLLPLAADRPDPAAGIAGELHARLGYLLRQATGADRRLIIFVDHLERCVPPRPVALLETVHHLLAQPNVVTVLATDVPVLAASVELKYRDVIASYERNAAPAPQETDVRQAYSRMYLRKIIRQQVDLPAPQPER